jgi:LmbE family N-acetylglucosaminyl deacetylase
VNELKIACITAHPDDVEMGIGGTLAKHVDNGDDVHVILTTLGGVVGPPKEREKEAQQAAHILGIDDLQILDYPVQKLNKPNLEFVKLIKSVLSELKPDRIYTHTIFDNHQVHVTVADSVMRASKEIKQVLSCEIISSTTTDFRPNAFVDITDYIELKIKSVKMHETQSNRFYIQPNVMRSLANVRYVWSKVGKNPEGYAEAFVIGKFIQ